MKLTLDNSKKQSEIETLSGIWGSSIHPSNGHPTLADLPCSVLLPDKASREVLVEMVMGTTINQGRISIGFKPSSEASVLCSCTVKDFLRIISRIIVDHLLLRKVNRQAIDRRPFQVHAKFKDVPHSLDRADVPGVKVGFDLIHSTLHLQSGTVRTFVYVLVYIFDGLDGGTDLQVHMALKLNQEGWRVWNNMSVCKDIKGNRICTLLDSATIIRTCILWIAILLHASLGTEVLGIALLTEAILQTAICIAGTMEHEVRDSFIELRMDICIRNLGRDEGVDLLWCAYLALFMEEDEEVHVRKATLLIFNGVHQSSNLSKVAISNLLQEGLVLLIEHSSHQVRTVNSSLT
jgi:hypothetical protein